MTYQRNTVDQLYGDQKYLAHQVTGNVDPRPFHVVGDRVSSYGIINFGAVSSNNSKQFLPVSNGITNDIMLRSLYSFTTDASKTETIFRLKNGTRLIGEWLFTADDMPYAFPDGAIINPNITIEIKPKNTVSQLLLYWQPVHVLSYLEI